jgi:hypothetical protein
MGRSLADGDRFGDERVHRQVVLLAIIRGRCRILRPTGKRLKTGGGRVKARPAATTRQGNRLKGDVALSAEL